MDLNNEFEVAVPVGTAWAVLTDLERIAPCMPGAQLEEVEGDDYRGQVKVKVGPITASYKGVARFLERDETGHKAVLKAEGRETRGQGNASATITAQLTEAGNGTKVAVSTDLNITGKVAQFGRGVLAEVSAKLLDQFVQNLEKTVLSPGGEGSSGDSDEGTGPVPSPKPRRARAGTELSSSTAGDPPGGAMPEAGTAPGTVVDTASAAEAAGSAAGAGSASGAGSTSGTGSSSGVRRIDGPEPEPVDLASIAGDSIAKRILPFASIAGAIFLIRIVIYAMKRRKK